MDIKRRDFFKVSGGAVAGLATTQATANSADSNALAKAAQAKATLDYPLLNIGKSADLAINVPKIFRYPDANSLCQMVKFDQAVPGGVGPEQSIVAYSILCPHMGCPLGYEAESRTFRCGCHFSIFDAELQGQQVCGQATQNLPRIELVYDAGDDNLYAIAVHGLIYGHQANI